MSKFIIYMIGALFVAFGFGYAAYEIGLGPVWIGIIAVIVLGFGIMAGIAKTQRKET